VQIPIDAFVLGLDGQAVGRRLTLGGTSIAPVVTTNVTLTSPLTRRVQITLGLYNALDARYGDPGGEEHRQTLIPQDGRTAAAKLRVSF
jgi:outer membrane receptor protein involved in Fe transport